MQHPLTLGGLAAGATVKGDFSQTFDRECYLVYAKGSWSLDHTAGEGPIECGFSHNDYTSGEIDECLESAAAWATDNKVANEQRTRKVRRVGLFSGVDSNEVLRDGIAIYRRLGWVQPAGSTLATWARTQETLTSGGNITFAGVVAVRWV